MGEAWDASQVEGLAPDAGSLAAGRKLALTGAWSDDGFTALHYACFFGTPEAAAVLLDAGAAIDEPSRNDMGVRPINAAAAGQHPVDHVRAARNPHREAERVRGHLVDALGVDRLHGLVLRVGAEAELEVARREQDDQAQRDQRDHREHHVATVLQDPGFVSHDVQYPGRDGRRWRRAWSGRASRRPGPTGPVAER